MRFKDTFVYKKFITHKRIQFILSLPKGTTLLDIGCGNHSPSFYHHLNSNINYYGVDIHEYNLDENDYKFAKQIYFVNADKFANEIKNLDGLYQAVVSAHNIEHTAEPLLVLDAMMEKLQKGGKLYLSFPSKATVNFPSRKGTLNFYDDETHQNLPVADKIIKQIESNNGKLIFYAKRYRTLYGFVRGIIQEPFSIFFKKIYSHTWHVWGFETIIIAEKQ